MTSLKRALPAVAMLAILAVPALAQVAGHPVEVSAGGGILGYDTRARLKDGWALDASLGLRVAPWFTAEMGGVYGRTDADTVPEPRSSLLGVFGDMRFNLRPAESRVVPFVLAGFGYGRSRVGNAVPDKLERGTPSVGAGALFNLFGLPRWFARVQIRDVLFKERESFEFSHHVAAVAALHYVWRGKYRDQDLDGVLDGLDKCADTPKGCKVDAGGCPIDADGDGVCDGLDTCAVTPKGARVDAHGCPIDADGDGVFDGLDQCEATPRACKVDDKGCPVDADGDGVCDGLDQCPGTPKGSQVDDKGCETQASQLEGDLLDTGNLRITGVAFETGKATPLPQSLASVDAVGQVLGKWPELKVEVGGHTDSQGDPAANLRLSRARADTVRAYLLQKFALPPDQLVPRGYGNTRPLTSNDSEQGRALNRRFEFVVLNKAVLVQAGGKRRLGGK